MWFLKDVYDFYTNLQGCTLAVARSRMRPENQPCDLGFLSGRRLCDQIFGLNYANICVVIFKQKVFRQKWSKDFFHTNLAIKKWIISMKKKTVRIENTTLFCLIVTVSLGLIYFDILFTLSLDIF